MLPVQQLLAVAVPVVPDAAPWVLAPLLVGALADWVALRFGPQLLPPPEALLLEPVLVAPVPVPEPAFEPVPLPDPELEPEDAPAPEPLVPPELEPEPDCAIAAVARPRERTDTVRSFVIIVFPPGTSVIDILPPSNPSSGTKFPKN